MPNSNRLSLLAACCQVGSYWQPTLGYNAATSEWVLWWVFSPKDMDAAFTMAQVATAPTAAGPFVLRNPNVTLRYRTFTSAQLFVDDDGGGGGGGGGEGAAGVAAYVMYSSRQNPEDEGNHFNPPVVERLSPSWTAAAAPGGSPPAPIIPFPPGSGSCQEGEVMFRRGDRYYLLMGRCCCFCAEGSNLMAYSAAHPLGPYTPMAEINTKARPPPPPPPRFSGTAAPSTPAPTQAPAMAGRYTVPCQQQGVTVIGGGSGAPALPAFMWSGERWQQSPDGTGTCTLALIPGTFLYTLPFASSYIRREVCPS